jgi:hypothetical protein
MKTRTIWRTCCVTRSYAGRYQWTHDPLTKEELWNDKFFEKREDAEAWLEPRARRMYEYALSDMSHNDPEYYPEMKAEYERLGGFKVEQTEERTSYWGPEPEHEHCRYGCCVASIEKTELIIDAEMDQESLQEKTEDGHNCPE